MDPSDPSETLKIQTNGGFTETANISQIGISSFEDPSSIVGAAGLGETPKDRVGMRKRRHVEDDSQLGFFSCQSSLPFLATILL